MELSDISYRHLLENAQSGILTLDQQGRVVFCNRTLLELLERKEEDTPGHTLHDLFGVDDDSFPAGTSRDIEVKDSRGYRRFLRLRELGRTREQGEGPWRWLAVQDATQQERAQRRNLALSQVAASLTFVGSLTEALNQIAANVVRTLDSVGCAIILAQGRRVTVLGTCGLPASYGATVQEVFDQGTVPVVALEAAQKGRIMVGRDYRLSLLPYVSSTEAREYLASATWNVTYSVPLTFRGRVLGTLTCYYERDPEPEDELLPFLQAVADQVALLVESARLTEELRGKAVLEERQRIAHELHDSVTQALYGIGLGADAALHHLEQGDTENLKTSLAYLSSQARVGMAEMRSLLLELRPETLRTEGLVTLLERQIAALEPRHGLKVTATLLEPSLEWEAKHVLYRVIQEALGNIAKHAGASQVELSMDEREGWLRVTIRDDGRGFDTSQPPPGHFGLLTMSERLRGLCGQLTLDSQPGGGTTVLAEVPFSVQR